jgi:cold shock CspA family protein/ribosome-associated translation inhibitor RaiA
MQLTPTITFRGMKHSRALESDILIRIAKLEHYYQSLVGCRVLIEFRERHHEAGNRFHVRIDLTVPNGEIVVSHEATLHGMIQDLDTPRLSKSTEPDPARKHAVVAIHEAFDTMRRRLQDLARRRRGAVKAAVRQPRGKIAEIFPVDRYGYIEAADGHQVYFQKNSVLGNAFDRLKVGSLVSYAEEKGEKGPQASTVKIVHPHRHRLPIGSGPAFAL